MKKVICIILSILMVLSLAACGAKADDGVFKVAIIQQLEHSSLDEICAGIQAELTALAAEKGVNVLMSALPAYEIALRLRDAL